MITVRMLLLYDSSILDPTEFLYIAESSRLHLRDIEKMSSQVTDSARTGQIDLCAL